MKAVFIIPGPEGGTLEFRETPEPEPRPGELLVRVKATALNRADLYQRLGSYPVRGGAAAGSPTIAGLEAAGEVVGTGEGVVGFEIGDRVMGSCQGGYAEFTTMHHRLAIPIPECLSWREAATIPVSYMTEHNALVTNAGLKAGESVLINAASSGVGVAAVQIAKICGAEPIIATSGDAAKLKTLLTLGVDVGINTQTENFVDAVLEATDTKGVDIIIDHVGGPVFKDNLKCLALCGRLVGVGRLGGRKSEIDLDFLALRRLHLIGVTFRTRTAEERFAIAEQFKDDLLPALTQGRLRPVIDRIFSLRDALEAQTYMASNAQMGKIVLTTE
ncbi:NAD(P)H-quinone oxidoreductase [Thermodesulfobacteriota bacterium]